jgi:prolipoprotein diacylglyceryltransferase
LGEKFWRKPKKYLHETGFYLQGGLLGGMLSILIIAPFAQVPLAVLADALGLGVLLGQVVGRIGCYNYGCCFGKPTKSVLSVCYTHEHSKVGRWRANWLHTRLHPTQLYMALQNFLGFICIVVLLKQPLASGMVFFLVMVWEGCARLSIEPLRADMNFSEGRNWRTVQVASGLALVGAIGAVWLWLNYHANASGVVFSGAIQSAFSQWLNSPHLWWFNFCSLMFIFVGYGVHGKKIGTFPEWSKVWSDLDMRLRARMVKTEKSS